MLSDNLELRKEQASNCFVLGPQSMRVAQVLRRRVVFAQGEKGETEESDGVIGFRPQGDRRLKRLSRLAIVCHFEVRQAEIELWLIIFWVEPRRLLEREDGLVVKLLPCEEDTQAHELRGIVSIEKLPAPFDRSIDGLQEQQAVAFEDLARFRAVGFAQLFRKRIL